MMYHAPGGYGTTPGPLYVQLGGQFCGGDRPAYPVEFLMGVNIRSLHRPHTSNSHPQVTHYTNLHQKKLGNSYSKKENWKTNPNTENPAAFGYESDDSSLSSNASSSTQSVDKGENRATSTPPLTAQEAESPPRRRWGVRPWQNGPRTRHHHPHQRNHRTPRIAPDRFLNSSYPFEIKYSPTDLLNGSKWDSLSQDIWDRFMAAQQTEDTFRKKMNLWRFLYTSIKAIFPRYGLYLMGSTMSGFGSDSSDMDLCLYVKVLDCMDSRAHALMHLGFILNYIKTYDSVISQAELIQAKVPILKFRDRRNGIEVDLNCNNVVGIRNTNLLYCYSQMDWRVRPLVILVKLWAQAHDINAAKHRTVSSYSLVLMAIHYLQCGTSPAVLPCLQARDRFAEGLMGAPLLPRRALPHHHSHNTQTLGELFLGFLRYYAEFEYDKYAVSVRTGKKVPVEECRNAKTQKNDPHQWKLLCVEEPFDLTNTARSVYDPEVFEHILDVFRKCYKTLESSNRLQDILEPSAAPQR